MERKAMGFFNKLLRKTPENVTAHIINPNSGYQTEYWKVGTDISEDAVSRLAEGENIYVVHVYESGKMEQIICKQEIWLSTKAQMDAIDKEGQAAMDKTKKMLDEFK